MKSVAKDPLRISAARRASNFLWASILPKTERRKEKWDIEIREITRSFGNEKKNYLRLLQLSERLLRIAGPAPKEIDAKKPPAIAMHLAMIAYNLLVGSNEGDLACQTSERLIALLHRHGYGAMFALSPDDKLNGVYGWYVGSGEKARLIAKFVREACNGFGVDEPQKVAAAVAEEEKKVEEEITKEQTIEELKKNESGIFSDMGSEIENLTNTIAKIKARQQADEKGGNSLGSEKKKTGGKKTRTVYVQDSGEHEAIEI